MDFEVSYKNLNAAQKEAVDTIEGPVMVVAGPGTGKTQVISLRIGNILKKTDTTPDGVLCLTFTNSGVHAMRKRLHSYIGAEAGRVAITTFHSFGIQVIEEFYHALGFASAPELLDDAGLLGIVDDILHSHEWAHLRPRGNAAMYFQDLKSLISLLKRENMSPDAFLSEIEKDIKRLTNDPESISSKGVSKGKLKKEILTKIESLEKTREVVRFYELYEEVKKERNVMDYDDVLSYLLKLVTDSENARDTLRERYLYVLVDEHQDSSGVQNAFLRAVWGDVEKPNVFVVGDDRQLIYGFGGASLSHFEDFTHTFKGTKVITLSENYRSTQIILDAADTLLKSVLTKESLKSQSRERHPIQLVEADYPRDEVMQAGHFFLEKMSGGTDASDCALLVPKNAHVRTAMHILSGMGVPVASSQSLRLFETKEFVSLFNVFQIMNDPFSNVAIAESVLDEMSGIPPLAAHAFLHRVYTRELSLQHLLDEGHSHGLLADADPIYSWGKKIETTIVESKGKSLYDIVQYVGYTFLLENATEHESYIRRVEVVRSLLHLALTLEEKPARSTGAGGDAHTSLATFISFIKRMQEYGQDVPLALLGTQHGVRVMTLHASKGLEYDCVWIAHMNERTLMSSKSIGFSLPEKVKEHIEEKNEAVARRELYVALTRAKRFCVLSYARMSHKGNEERLAMIIDELPKALFEFSDGADTQNKIVQAGKYIEKTQSATPNVSRDELRELVAEQYHKTKVSVTLLNNFYECPWKWYFRSFLQVPEPMAESLVFGSIVHGTIEQLVKYEDARNTKGIELAIANEIKKNHLVEEKTIARFTREATAVAERFLENFIPDLWEESQSEKALSYKDPRIPNVLITGKIDLVESSAGADLRVTDFKTGKTRTSKDVEKEDDEGRLSSYLRQLAMYSYLIYNASKGSQEVSKSRLYFVEEKDEKKAVYETHVSGEHIELLVKDIQDYDQEMQNGKWTERTCNFKPWGSGATECPYCKLAEMYSSR